MIFADFEQKTLTCVRHSPSDRITSGYKVLVDPQAYIQYIGSRNTSSFSLRTPTGRNRASFWRKCRTSWCRYSRSRPSRDPIRPYAPCSHHRDRRSAPGAHPNLGCRFWRGRAGRLRKKRRTAGVYDSLRQTDYCSRGVFSK